MFTLNLLGGAAFHGRNGPVTGKAAHKRRIALLAILAGARGRAVGRERIIGLLWPEHRGDAARHLLSESLYVLRKELGDQPFVSSGDEVALNGDVVRSDVEAFETAIEAGDVEQAAALYRGPFLDGFFVGDAPEFERWAEGERDRLARIHTRALECLAIAREGEGRPAEAAGWWRRLVALDPYNSRVATRLMLALDASGERAAALWFAEKHVAFLRDELGVEPEDDFEELVERLRTEPVRVPAGDRAAPGPPPAPPADATEPADSPVGAAQPADAQAEARAAEQAVSPAASLEPEDETAGDSGDAITSTGTPVDPPVEDEERETGADPREGAAQDDLPAVVPYPPPAFPVDDRALGDMPPPAETPGADVVAPITASLGGAPGAVAPRIVARSGRGRARRPLLAAALGVILGAAGSFIPDRSERPTPPPAMTAEAPGNDPRRIAVLYFDDYSRGGELGYLANGLTEMLIHALSQVPALEVISRNGVKPYRERAVRFDSLVADLRVGSVVEGSVQRSGDSVRVTFQLIETRTQAHLASRTLTYPLTEVFALEDALADEVSRSLRRWLGREVELREMRAETRSTAAWGEVMRAEEVADEAAAVARGGEPQDAATADRLLERADSLLVTAERHDPQWSRPTLLRGWAALRRATLSAARRDAGFADALAHAGRVLRRDPGNANALELRGTARFKRALAAGTGGQAEAERDLRAAVAADSSLAQAWSTLSQVLRVGGRFVESDLAARRALAADAYLEEADDILHRLFFGALLTGDYAEARSACDAGRRRFPGDWRFLECTLTLLREDRRAPADADAAMRLVAALDRVDPPARAVREGRAYSPLYRRAVAAAILARAGRADSARRVLARVRQMAGDDVDLRASLGYDEAYARLLLGERPAARALLAEALASRPALRPFAERDPLLREIAPPAPPAATGTPPAAGASRSPGRP